MFNSKTDLATLVKKSAIPLVQVPQDIDAAIPLLKDKSFILLGEATHGTQEFYAARVAITKRLILNHGLNAIAIEGDWPSAYRVNQFIRWQGTDQNANDALGDFQRFPLWMWRNPVILDFIIWLRQHNEGLRLDRQVGFYGLDMYSLYESVAAVLEYLDQVDPEAAKEARERYACLDHIGSERHYGYGVKLGKRPSCEEEVLQQLLDLQARARTYSKPGHSPSEDDLFAAERNAQLIKSAEAYYRKMFDNRANTWNLRDSHMFETLQALHIFLSRRTNSRAKIAVWEHNSHLGDARATYMGDRAQHNLGQLVREAYAADCALIGFTTFNGTVTAASEWDGEAQRKKIRDALPNSIEDIFHRTGLNNFFISLHGQLAHEFSKPLLQRAIGVLYLPQSERASHYFHCSLAKQFDAIFHFDKTTALEPLDAEALWVKGEEETYPFGL